MNPVTLDAVSQGLAIFIQIATIITLIYALFRFAGKTNVSQNSRIAALEDWQAKVITRLAQGDEHMSELDESNRVTQKALLAMLSHEISGNDIEKLKEARRELETYLIQK